MDLNQFEDESYEGFFVTCFRIVMIGGFGALAVTDCFAVKTHYMYIPAAVVAVVEAWNWKQVFLERKERAVREVMES